MDKIIAQLKKRGENLTDTERNNIYEWWVQQGIKTNQPLDWFKTLFNNLKQLNYTKKNIKKYVVWWGQQKGYGREA